MNVIIFLCELLPCTYIILLAINKILVMLKKREPIDMSDSLFVTMPLLGVIGTIMGVFILTQNSIVGAMLGKFDANDFPSGTEFYCYSVLTYENENQAFVPSRVVIETDIDGKHYFLDSYFQNGVWEDVDYVDVDFEHDEILFINEYTDAKVKLLNIPYEGGTITYSTNGKLLEYADLFIALLDIVYGIFTYSTLKKRSDSLK